MSTNLTPDQRLIVALDVSTISEAQILINDLSPDVSTFKLGYWLLFDAGLHGLIADLKSRGKQVFLDAKLNDIPETVRHGVAAVARLGVDFITVHSDADMLQAAVEGAADYPVRIMAVTALTSLAAGASRDRFRAGVVNAIVAGCDGLIMSPADLADPMRLMLNHDGAIRDLAGSNMIIATPGVRMAGQGVDDHGRTGTPSVAIKNGADYIIVGRPIIRAENPLEAARNIIASL